MDLRGYKQATAHSHEHTKNSNPCKNYSRNDKIRIRIFKLIPKKPEIVRIRFERNSMFITLGHWNRLLHMRALLAKRKRQVRPDHEATLLDGTAPSVRNGEPLRDRSRQP